MTRCAACGAQGLHIEYRRIGWFGTRPVLCDERGREHDCLSRVVEDKHGATVYRQNGRQKTLDK